MNWRTVIRLLCEITVIPQMPNYTKACLRYTWSQEGIEQMGDGEMNLETPPSMQLLGGCHHASVGLFDVVAILGPPRLL